MRKLLALTCVVALATSACSVKKNKDSDDDKPNRTKIVDTGEILKSTDSAEEKSMKLTKAAEDLYSPFSFMHAYDVLVIATELDPKNSKAKLMRALLEPIMLNKGVYKRLRPLVNKSGSEAQKRFDHDIKEKKKGIPQSATSLRAFLFNTSQPAFESEEEVRNHLIRVHQTMDQSRKIVSELKNARVTINVAQSLRAYGTLVKRRTPKHECWTGTYTYFANDYNYPRSHPQYGSRREYTEYWRDCGDVEREIEDDSPIIVEVGDADAEVIQQAIAGAQIFSIPGMTYSTLGGTNVMKKLLGESTTNKEQIEVIENQPELGVLKSTQYLDTIKSLGSDVVAATKWMLTIQQSVCPDGITKDDSRPGFLFSQGICRDQARDIPGTTLDRLIRDVSNSLIGGEVIARSGSLPVWDPVTFEETQEFHESLVRPSVAIDSPVNDLKNQLPSEFNDCGNATALKDNSLGGVFVNRDADVFLSYDGKLNRICD